MTLSVVIPARNEAESIRATVRSITDTLRAAEIDYEVIVVDDSSTDGTFAAVEQLTREDPAVRALRSHYRNGFGFAVRAGLDRYTGDAVAIVMADGSDDPADLVRYHALLADGWDCVFGSRFAGGRRVTNYPRLRLVLNRLANGAIRCAFRHGLDDTTNAFKAYRREVIEGVAPLTSGGFELTAELPLKAIVRGYRFTVTPVSWRGRTAGTSKFSLTGAGRYARVVVAVLGERRRLAARPHGG